MSRAHRSGSWEEWSSRTGRGSPRQSFNPLLDHRQPRRLLFEENKRCLLPSDSRRGRECGRPKGRTATPALGAPRGTILADRLHAAIVGRHCAALTREWKACRTRSHRQYEETPPLLSSRSSWAGSIDVRQKVQLA